MTRRIVRSAAERTAEIYTPPANVSIAPSPPPPRPRRTVSTAEAIAEANREQAGVLRELAAELVRAREAGAWEKVSAVAVTLGAIAHGLEELSC